MWPCSDPNLNKKWNEKVQNGKKILLRQHKTCKAELSIRWSQIIIVLMFWRTYSFLEIHGCRGNMIGVLEFALTYLPTTKGKKKGANRSYNFQRLFFVPPSYKQPMHPNPSPLKHSATLKTQAFLKHFQIWATQDAGSWWRLPIGITYSQINHLTFLQHHKIYTFAPA